MIESTTPVAPLTWRVSIPLLSDRFIMRDTLLAGLAIALVGGTGIGGLFALGGGAGGWRAGFIFAGVFAAFYLVVALFSYAVVFGNRWPLEFAVGPDGVVMNNVSEKARGIHRVAVVFALLSGRPQLAGAGMLAQARELEAIAWPSVTAVRLQPALRVISVKGGLLQHIRVYCTADNYADVSALVLASVRQHATTATIA